MAPSHGSLADAKRTIDHLYVVVDSIDFKVLKAYYAILCDKRADYSLLSRVEQNYNEHQITQIELLIQYKRWRTVVRKDYRNAQSE